MVMRLKGLSVIVVKTGNFSEYARDSTFISTLKILVALFLVRLSSISSKIELTESPLFKFHYFAAGSEEDGIFAN